MLDKKKASPEIGEVTRHNDPTNHPNRDDVAEEKRDLYAATFTEGVEVVVRGDCPGVVVGTPNAHGEVVVRFEEGGATHQAKFHAEDVKTKE